VKTSFYIIFIIFLSLLATAITPVRAAKVKFGFIPGFETLSGHTTYQIGGKATDHYGRVGYQRDPTSELEFPLDVIMFNFGWYLQVRKPDTGSIELNLKFKKNLTADAGKMKDSDWGILEGEEIWGGPDTLDMYSESDTKLDVFSTDFNIRYHFPKTANILTLSLGFGAKYQHLECEVSNLDHWYPSENDYYGLDPDEGRHVRISGLIGTYEVTYGIIYPEVGVNLLLRNHVNFVVRLGYTPLVTAKDEDHHLLRDLVSKGDCHGDAVLFSFEGGYTFHFGLFLSLRYEYVNIETEGTMNAYMYDINIWTIEERIKSEQESFAIVIGYKF